MREVQQREEEPKGVDKETSLLPEPNTRTQLSSSPNLHTTRKANFPTRDEDWLPSVHRNPNTNVFSEIFEYLPRFAERNETTLLITHREIAREIGLLCEAYGARKSEVAQDTASSKEFRENLAELVVELNHRVHQDIERFKEILSTSRKDCKELLRNLKCVDTQGQVWCESFTQCLYECMRMQKFLGSVFENSEYFGLLDREIYEAKNPMEVLRAFVPKPLLLRELQSKEWPVNDQADSLYWFTTLSETPDEVKLLRQHLYLAFGGIPEGFESLGGYENEIRLIRRAFPVAKSLGGIQSVLESPSGRVGLAVRNSVDTSRLVRPRVQCPDSDDSRLRLYRDDPLPIISGVTPRPDHFFRVPSSEELVYFNPRLARFLCKLEPLHYFRRKRNTEEQERSGPAPKELRTELKDLPQVIIADLLKTYPEQFESPELTPLENLKFLDNAGRVVFESLTQCLVALWRIEDGLVRHMQLGEVAWRSPCELISREFQMLGIPWKYNQGENYFASEELMQENPLLALKRHIYFAYGGLAPDRPVSFISSEAIDLAYSIKKKYLNGIASSKALDLLLRDALPESQRDPQLFKKFSYDSLLSMPLGSENAFEDLQISLKANSGPIHSLIRDIRFSLKDFSAWPSLLRRDRTEYSNYKIDKERKRELFRKTLLKIDPMLGHSETLYSANRVGYVTSCDYCDVDGEVIRQLYYTASLFEVECTHLERRVLKQTRKQLPKFLTPDDIKLDLTLQSLPESKQKQRREEVEKALGGTSSIGLPIRLSVLDDIPEGEPYQNYPEHIILAALEYFHMAYGVIPREPLKALQKTKGVSFVSVDGRIEFTTKEFTSALCDVLSVTHPGKGNEATALLSYTPSEEGRRLASKVTTGESYKEPLYTFSSTASKAEENFHKKLSSKRTPFNMPPAAEDHRPGARYLFSSLKTTYDKSVKGTEDVNALHCKELSELFTLADKLDSEVAARQKNRPSPNFSANDELQKERTLVDSILKNYFPEVLEDPRLIFQHRQTPICGPDGLIAFFSLEHFLCAISRFEYQAYVELSVRDASNAFIFRPMSGRTPYQILFDSCSLDKRTHLIHAFLREKTVKSSIGSGGKHPWRKTQEVVYKNYLYLKALDNVTRAIAPEQAVLAYLELLSLSHAEIVKEVSTASLTRHSSGPLFLTSFDGQYEISLASLENHAVKHFRETLRTRNTKKFLRENLSSYFPSEDYHKLAERISEVTPSDVPKFFSAMKKQSKKTELLQEITNIYCTSNNASDIFFGLCSTGLLEESAEAFLLFRNNLLPKGGRRASQKPKGEKRKKNPLNATVGILEVAVSEELIIDFDSLSKERLKGMLIAMCDSYYEGDVKSFERDFNSEDELLELVADGRTIERIRSILSEILPAIREHFVQLKTYVSPETLKSEPYEYQRLPIIRALDGTAPLVLLNTGGGKSHCIAHIAEKQFERGDHPVAPVTRALIVTPPGPLEFTYNKFQEEILVDPARAGKIDVEWKKLTPAQFSEQVRQKPYHFISPRSVIDLHRDHPLLFRELLKAYHNQMLFIDEIHCLDNKSGVGHNILKHFVPQYAYGFSALAAQNDLAKGEDVLGLLNPNGFAEFVGALDRGNVKRGRELSLLSRFATVVNSHRYLPFFRPFSEVPVSEQLKLGTHLPQRKVEMTGYDMGAEHTLLYVQEFLYGLKGGQLSAYQALQSICVEPDLVFGSSEPLALFNQILELALPVIENGGNVALTGFRRSPLDRMARIFEEREIETYDMLGKGPSRRYEMVQEYERREASRSGPGSILIGQSTANGLGGDQRGIEKVIVVDPGLTVGINLQTMGRYDRPISLGQEHLAVEEVQYHFLYPKFHKPTLENLSNEARALVENSEGVAETCAERYLARVLNRLELFEYYEKTKFRESGNSLLRNFQRDLAQRSRLFGSIKGGLQERYEKGDRIMGPYLNFQKGMTHGVEEDFIASNTHLFGRDVETLSAVFLPGPAAPECEMFRRLGLDMERVTARENDKVRYALIEARSKLEGFRFEKGSLEKYLHTRSSDINLTDTDGCFSHKMAGAYIETEINEAALVLKNALAGRENITDQALYKFFRSGERSDLDVAMAKLYGTKLISRLKLAGPLVALKVFREVQNIASWLSEPLSDRLGVSQEDLQDFLLEVGVGSHHLKDITRFSYVSPTGQRFVSAYYALSRWDESVLRKGSLIQLSELILGLAKERVECRKKSAARGKAWRVEMSRGKLKFTSDRESLSITLDGVVEALEYFREEVSVENRYRSLLGKSLPSLEEVYSECGRVIV